MPNFDEFPDIGSSKPPKMPELDALITPTYESNKKAKIVRDYLVKLTNEDLFDENHFRKTIDEWNEKFQQEFTGQFGTIESVAGKHGKVKVYLFANNVIKFGFDLRT